MIAVIQRVKHASVAVEERMVAAIGQGLLVFLAVEKGDEQALCAKMADKISGLRVFEDEAQKMRFDVRQVKGEVLLISQFTLAADLSSGRRPGFSGAERPERAESLYEQVADELRGMDVSVKQGVFGADMQVSLLNDGPATFHLSL
ncbi:MAG: D-aminoacyl-tRNA deacylase [Pseudomonadota bacterium]|nr:D-aminoacyl-tRNA deacylase [Pseudomonadota bacterium]